LIQIKTTSKLKNPNKIIKKISKLIIQFTKYNQIYSQIIKLIKTNKINQKINKKINNKLLIRHKIMIT